MKIVNSSINFQSKTIHLSTIRIFLRIEGDEYIISLDPPPRPHPQLQTHRVSAYRAWTQPKPMVSQSTEPRPRGPQPELHTRTDLRGDQRGDFLEILPDFRRGIRGGID